MADQAPRFFSVVKWEQYQGETKRKPAGPDWVAPWFRLYHRLLDDYDFANLSESDRFLWLGILCLASRTHNKIRADQDYLQHQLRTKLLIPLETFSSFGWIDVPKHSRKVREVFAKDSSVEESRVEESRVEEKNPLSGKPDDAPTDPSQNGHIPYAEIIGCLNEHAGTQYRSTASETQRCIRARWTAGFRLEDFEKVVRQKVAAWKDDPRMAIYLRPQTLFGTKFEAYLNEPEAEEGFGDRGPWGRNYES